jgi:NAD(P)-dependent dehydrogenase (short-subunit alcohol dehydrogenase family)
MKTIFITGASRGIGLELTKQLLANGNSVIASCRNPEEAEALMGCRQKFEKLEIMRLQVDDENSVRSCFTSLEQAGRGIDLLFNNAGIIDWDDLHSVSKESLEKTYLTNLIGALLVLRASVPCLRKSTDPLAINLSSRLGSIALRGNTQLGGAIAYQCSKASLNMLTKQASIDLASLGIRVISLSPGWVRTEMGGSEAKYEVSESVRLMLETIDNLNPGDSGVFLGEDGSEISW